MPVCQRELKRLELQQQQRRMRSPEAQVGGYWGPFLSSWGTMFFFLMACCSWLQFGTVQAAVFDPMTHLRDDISRIKVMMETVGEQLERFNSLYLVKLETRFVSTANTLGHIDANIKNLQERAHVWDTFQLHVSAWNEQIKSLDKKLEILSRGAEKWDFLDEKMASLLPVDQKIDKMRLKIDDMDSKLNDLLRKSNGGALGRSSGVGGATPVPETPLFSEYTSRGILSALKDIEIKLNRLADAKTNQNSAVKTAGSPKTVNCTSEQMMTLMNDMAGKIDFILDKLIASNRRHPGGNGRPTPDVTYDVNYYDDNEDYSVAEDDRNRMPERAFLRLWRKMMMPFRRANKKMENLDKIVPMLESLANQTLATRMVKDLQEDMSSNLQCCRSNEALVKSWAKVVDTAFENLMSQVNEASRKNERCTETFEEKLNHQTTHLETVISKQTPKVCQVPVIDPRKERAKVSELPNEEENVRIGTPTSRDVNPSTPLVDVTTPMPPSPGCEARRLTEDLDSKVYSLATGKELNEGGRDYYTRFCDMKIEGGGWTVIQRRGDFGEPRENFSVTWRDYKMGFGNLNQEFWFGNDYIHRLTHEEEVVLRVELWDFEGHFVYAEYDSFRVASEEELYRLWVSGYRGNATDSFSAHSGYPFSTVDKNHDEAPPCCPCSPAYGGGWWFYSCFEANLNGVYHTNPTDNDYFRGIIWELWKGDYSLKATQMKIRAKSFIPPPSTPTVLIAVPEEPTEPGVPATSTEEIPEDP